MLPSDATLTSSSHQPFAYTLYSDSYGRSPKCFPTLEATIRWCAQELDITAASALMWPPAVAHYADGRAERVSREEVMQFVEEVPVDREPIVREVEQQIEASLKSYQEAYPTEEDRAYERRNRYSGQGWLFEWDKEMLVGQKVELLRWKWKEGIAG